MSYLKLIRLLYSLDREALLRWGRPVTTDRYVPRTTDPLSARILGLIRQELAPGTEPSGGSPPESCEVTLTSYKPPVSIEWTSP